MRVNRDLIGGFIGVHVSSIIKRFSRQFQAYLFFYGKISCAQKATKHKTNDFHPLRSCLKCCLGCLVFA